MRDMHLFNPRDCRFSTVTRIWSGYSCRINQVARTLAVAIAAWLPAGLVQSVSGLAQTTAHRGQAEQEKVDLYALVLIGSDVATADQMMSIYDRDDDGLVDKEEQVRIRWKKEIKDFDLNRDGKLAHLEFALREAKLRGDHGITAFDVNNVNKFLMRHDKNRNRQLDPVEIESGGWPSNPEDYDANGDGIISEKEMQRQFAFNRGLRREMGIEAVDQTGAMAIVNRFDTDGDKQLSEEERKNVPLPKPAKDFDEDGNGNLAMIEIATMLARHRRDTGLTKPDTFKVRRLFQQFDLNGDGKIGNDEVSFPDSLQKQYMQYDGNSDGVVTIAEVEKIIADSRREKGYIEEDFEKAKVMLRRHDENKSKFIEEFELHATPKPGQLPRTVLSADRDGDQRISLDELSRYFAAQRKRKG